jgi:positive regulator of sigma E activity
MSVLSDINIIKSASCLLVSCLENIIPVFDLGVIAILDAKVCFLDVVEVCFCFCFFLYSFIIKNVSLW